MEERVEEQLRRDSEYEGRACVKVVVTDKEMGVENEDDKWPRREKKLVRLILYSHWTCP